MKTTKYTKMIFLLILTILTIVLSSTPALAHGEEDFARAEQIIMDKTPCDELTLDQLELIGDYYMEQMHPGEMHEIMDERMGGEGSESLRQAHINIAESFYCGEHDAMEPATVNTMMGRTGTGYMMGRADTGYIMGSGTYSVFSTMWVLWIFVIALAGFIFGLTFWLSQRLLNQKKR